MNVILSMHIYIHKRKASDRGGAVEDEIYFSKVLQLSSMWKILLSTSFNK